MKAQKMLVLFFAVLIFGCEKKEDGARPRGDPLDYFFTRVGTAWTYKITLGEVKPLRYEEVLWPQGGSAIRVATRGLFLASFNKEEKKEFLLKMRVKGLASKQGKIEYPIGVELEIEEDGFGIFEYHRISIGDKSPDSLLFIGIDTSPSGNSNCLHFQRKVASAEKKAGEDLIDLDKAFTEDTWFARGKGLVYLVQKIDGEISMTWILTDFSQ